MEPETEPLTRRGIEIVSSDLLARGWAIEPSGADGPARLCASRPGTRRVVYLACSRYPDAPPDRVGPVLAEEGSEVWLARVQLTRKLAPMLSPDYVRLPHEGRRAEVLSVSAPWPPVPAGLSF